MTHPYAADRESAVEWLQSELRFVDRTTKGAPASEYSVSLPYDVAVLVLECARKGLRKGQGRGGNRRRGRFSQLRRMAVIWWAKSRKAELVAEAEQQRAEQRQSRRARRPSSRADLELEAAREASDYAHKRYGLNLAVGTIKREMGYSDDTLVQRVATHWD
jgi:hypothetical protein